MGRPLNRRKSRLVDREFQVGLAWRMLIAFLLFSSVGVFLVFIPSMFRLATGSDIASLEPAAQEFLILHRRIWPAALFVAVGMFVYTVVLSHRIAGPIYRINAVLRKIAEGEAPGEITLRRGDFFRETAGLVTAAFRAAGAARNPPSPPEGPGEENT